MHSEGKLERRGKLRLQRVLGTWSVGAFLFVLAIATSLPVAVCAASLAYHFVSESSQLKKAEYEDRLRLMRNATELRVANIIEDLQILAQSPSLAESRFSEFREHAVQAVNLIGGVAIALYAPDGQQLVNTRLDPGSPLPKRIVFDVERRAIETGSPQVSGLNKAVVDGQPIVTIAVPVKVAGTVRYALNVGLSTKYLAGLMDDYITGGLVGSIIDANGTILARRSLLDADDRIGQPTIPEVRAHLGEPAAWWIKANSRSGVPTYTSLLRSNQSGWIINLGVPREIIDGPLHRTLEWIVALTLFTFVLGLILARIVAHRFLTEFSDLERYVLSLRAGVGKPEFGKIAEVNRMMRALHRVGSELAAALRDQKTLLDEVNHRVKNTLGTVQSIARLSRANSGSLDQYADGFENRLHALSGAYNLLTANNWSGASLTSIVQRTLAPYAGSGRLDVSGPQVMLIPKLALAISAVLQELSANAAKYGAFSSPSGKVSVSWTVQPADVVAVTWVESEGPPVREPTRRGFGTKLIASVFAAEPGWSVEMNFAPGGLRCAMRFLTHEREEPDDKTLIAAG